jgi:hypothetical protein
LHRRKTWVFIEKRGKVFICETNNNRLAATSKQEREKGCFVRAARMELPDGETGTGIFKGFEISGNPLQTSP